MQEPQRRVSGDAFLARLSAPAQYTLTLVLVAVTTAVLGLLASAWGPLQNVEIENPGTAYIVPVAAAAVLFGLSAAVVALGASFACIALFFAARESGQELLVLLVTMVLVVALAERQRRTRVRAEGLLRDLERERGRTCRIFEATPFGLALFRTDDFSVVDANAAYAAQLEQYTGVPFTPNYPLATYLPTFPETEAGRLLQAAAAENRTIRRERFTATTQPDRYYDWTIQPVPLDEGTTGALLSIEEVTERVHAERERERLRRQVEEQAAQLEASFADTVDGIAIYDAAGNVLRRNRANHEILDLDPDRAWERFEIVEKVHMRYPDGTSIPPDDLHASRALRGETVRGEVVLITDRAGNDRYLRQNAAPIRAADGTITGAILVTNDVTEDRARAEERAALVGQVERQAAELEAAFGAIINGVTVYDTEGRVIRRNTAYYDILRLDPTESWPRERVLRTLRLRRLDGTPMPPTEGHVSRALRGETVRDATVLITDGAGNDRYLRENASPVYAADGSVVGAVLVFSDATEELRRERERENLLTLMEERRQFAQTIFDNVPICLAVVDADTMQYQAVNPAYRAAMPASYRDRDPFGLAVPEVFAGEANAAFVARVQRAGQEGIPYSERAARYEDPERGTTYWDEMAVPLSFGGASGHFVLLQIMDVTERVEAQERIAALAAAEAARAREFEAVFASLGEGLLLTDTEGRIIRYNRAAGEILGVDAAPLTSVREFRQRFETIPEDGTAASEAQYISLDTLRGVDTAVFTRRFRNGRGEPRTMRLSASAIYADSGEVTGAVVIFADITRERREAEERARLAREVEARAAQLETIISSIPDGVGIGDAHGQTWQFNPAARRIFGVDPKNGYSPERRTTLYAVRHLDGTPVDAEELPAERVLRGETFSAVEHIVNTPRGDRILSTGGAPIRDAAGAVAGIVLIYRDITEGRRADLLMTRLGRTLDASSNEIYVLDAAFFGVMQANERARRNLGYGTDDLTQRTLLDLAPGLDEETLNLLVAPLRDDEEPEVVVEMQLRRADGTTYPAAARLYLSRDETPPVFVAVVQDITERHAALRQREEFFREIDARRRFAQTIVETVPAGIAVFSVDDAFTVRLCNRPYAQMFAMPGRSESIIGQGVHASLPEVENTGLLALFRQVRDTGEPLTLREFEYHGTTRGVEYFDWNLVPLREIGSRVTGLLLLVTDATERVRTRQRIEELAWDAAQRANELEAVIASIADGVIVTNATGEITLENAAMRRMMGRRDAAATFALAVPQVDGGADRGGSRISVPVEDFPLARAARGETLTDQVLAMRDPDTEEERYLLCSGAPVRAPDGEITGAVAVFRDITAIKQVEQMKDEFLSVAAHELRTPLTAIKGYAELLDRRLSGTEGRERDRQPLTVIRKQADRLAKLVNEMLDVSRIESGRLQLNREPFDLSTLAGETVQHLRVTSDTHTLVLDAAPEVVVLADPSRIEQVLINLVSNAITYSPEGGVVSVDVGVRGGAAGDEAVVSVRDNGIGIAPDALPQVFSRFYRATEASALRSGGMGLGLYICREIIERHGGTITAESTMGVGSIFIFTLPLARANDEAGE